VRKTKVEGFRELEAALADLPKATGKNVLKRVLLKAAKPIEDAARANAPKLSGALERNVTTGTKLNRRQASMAKKLGKAAVEVHVGASDPAGVQTEFGNEHQAAEPWLRPAWDAEADGALDVIKNELGTEIDKAAARAARRAAKRAAG
jgi:HK97 gp10 family phage protein